MNYMIQHCVTKRTMSLGQKGKSLYLHRGYNMHRSREAETEEIIIFCKQRVKHVSKILKIED